MTRPVRSRTSCSWPASRSSSQRSAVRRSCQTSALWTGSPVFGSQATTVSRWLVIPIAFEVGPRDLRRRRARRGHLPGHIPDLVRHRARPSPGAGSAARTRCRRGRRSCPSSSKTRQVVPVVPWSIARITRADLSPGGDRYARRKSRSWRARWRKPRRLRPVARCSRSARSPRPCGRRARRRPSSRSPSRSRRANGSSVAQDLDAHRALARDRRARRRSRRALRIAQRA